MRFQQKKYEISSFGGINSNFLKFKNGRKNGKS